MKTIQHRRVKIVKISELTNAVMPHNIIVGYEVLGIEFHKPEIGKPYRVYHQHKTGLFQTSTVMDIKGNVITTRNSKYRLTYENVWDKIVRWFKL